MSSKMRHHRRPRHLDCVYSTLQSIQWLLKMCSIWLQWRPKSTVRFLVSSPDARTHHHSTRGPRSTRYFPHSYRRRPWPHPCTHSHECNTPHCSTHSHTLYCYRTCCSRWRSAHTDAWSVSSTGRDTQSYSHSNLILTSSHVGTWSAMHRLACCNKKLSRYSHSSCHMIAISCISLCSMTSHLRRQGVGMVVWGRLCSLAREGGQQGISISLI